jgi:hypothetical protein
MYLFFIKYFYLIFIIVYILLIFRNIKNIAFKLKNDLKKNQLKLYCSSSKEHKIKKKHWKEYKNIVFKLKDGY